MDSQSGTQFMHPRLKLLVEAKERATAPEKKIWISRLKRDDVVEVKTFNTLYVLRIVNPEDFIAEVTSDGDYITFPKKFFVSDPIVVDRSLRLKAIEADRTGNTMTVDSSAVQKIAVNGSEI